MPTAEPAPGTIEKLRRGVEMALCAGCDEDLLRTEGWDWVHWDTDEEECAITPPQPESKPEPDPDPDREWDHDLPAHYFREHDPPGWGVRCPVHGVLATGLDKMAALRGARRHERRYHPERFEARDA